MNRRPGLEQGLDEAMSRLDVALHGVSNGAAALSFDLSMSEPERELLASLGSFTDNTLLSFSADAAPVADEGVATRLLDQLIDRARTRASVNTELGGTIVASTWVGFGGDITSIVPPTLEPAALERHSSALGEALRDQHERTILLLSILQMATKIALATGSGNPLLAVSAAWRFIHGVMRDQANDQRGPER